MGIDTIAKITAQLPNFIDRTYLHAHGFSTPFLTIALVWVFPLALIPLYPFGDIFWSLGISSAVFPTQGIKWIP
jgi:hypothetical protein